MDNNLVNIIDVKVNNVTQFEAVSEIEKFLLDGKKHLVVTPYSESIVSAYHDNEYKELLNHSSLAVPDGNGLLAAAEFLDYKLPKSRVQKIIVALVYGLLVGVKLVSFPHRFKLLREPVHGVDLLVALCGQAEKRQYRVYLLGGLGNVAKKAEKVLVAMYPNLQIKSDPGPVNIEKISSKELNLLISSIDMYSPDFLFVAFRPVFQEKWLNRNMNKINAKIFMAVGGAFDMISGQKKRAPEVFQRLGLEWLWRLFIEPKRIMRIFNAVIIFPLLVLKEKLKTS